ncbi:hypothetical protein KVP09_05295 [Alcaligenaceae bacterium CGII-47]|nr:hypothetical protein [Alcaligenaceae bacterium CGII-47]
MLQDLDSLAERIRQLVGFTRQLQAERASLQARLRQLEQECSVLKDQQVREHDEFTRMSERVARHDQELEAVRAQAHAEHAALAAQVHEYQTVSEANQLRIERSETDRDRLRQVAHNAQEQIDLILMRLPGAE